MRANTENKVKLTLVLVTSLLIVGFLAIRPAPTHCRRDILSLIDTQRVEAATDSKRSAHWPTVEKQFKKLHPYCAYCGWMPKSKDESMWIQIHHVHQFRDMTPKQKGSPIGDETKEQAYERSAKEPGGELNPANLMSLCERPCANADHHLELGHTIYDADGKVKERSFKVSNPRVREMCAANRKKLESAGMWPAESK